MKLINLQKTLIFAASILLCSQVMATQAGWRQISVPGTAPDAPPMVVALYYPTQAPARTIAMGPFTVQVAIQAPPDSKFKGLIVLSHGTGGSELGHSSLAEALARNGYLVASLRHPGDNWQDRSLLQKTPERYFIERPQQASRVIDALLRDPEWRERISVDAKGPRIGAIGHSAGGYTVLALAGGQPDRSRIASHCASDRADDPIFCSMGRTESSGANAAAPVAPSTASLRDPRVRAIVALAPVGVVVTKTSLNNIRIPAAIYAAELDRFVVPRFHAEWVAGQLPGAELHRIKNAWHFAFMDAPSMSIQTEDGDIKADPPGFDRAALLERLARELPAFFDKALF
jgi:predicted dienelactone hydrolase